MSTQRSKRVKGITGSCFKVELEYGLDEKLVMVHFSDIQKMTKEVFLELKELLTEWTDFFYSIGMDKVFAGVSPRNYKMNRLAVMLGFEYISNNAGYNIYQYRSL